MTPILWKERSPRAGRSSRRGRRRRIRGFERLEDRSLLALFLVNSPLDTVDANPGDGIAQDAAGQTTLRSAVMEANARAGDDTILLGPGTNTFSLAGANEDSAASGDLDVVPNGRLTITGAGAGLTIIDAAQLDRVFHVLAFASLSISGVTIRNGSIPAGDGGGILNTATLTISNSVITANTAARGGGVFNAGVVTVSSSALSANTASGGGLYNVGTATIAESTVSGNTGAGEGSVGGVHNGSGTLTLSNSTVSSNTAKQVGGIFNNAQLNLKSSTVASNSATIGGGPNAAGGIANSSSGTTAVQNTIISGNSGGGGPPDFAGVVASQGKNLIGNTTGSSGWTASDLQNVDPLLGPLANNGGPTQTHALLAGSPAINAGINVGAFTTDQRGAPFVRLFDDRIDIGAFERQTLRFTVDTIVDENDGIYRTGDLSLREAIALTNGNPSHDTIDFASSLGGELGATIVLSLGELQITSDLTVTGPGANRLAISGNGSRVVNVAADSTVNVAGLTIRDGRATQGGGISNSGTLTISNSTVTGNSAASLGGGIYNSQSGTLANISSTISDNTATGADGNGGGIYNLGTLTVASSTISSNSASPQASSGGGIYSQSGSVSITNSTISGNVADQTGGIYNNAQLTLKNSTVSANVRTAFAETPNDGSGGVTNSSSGTVTVQNTIIAGNTASTASGVPDFLGAVASLDNNLIGNTGGSTGWLASDLQNVDPRLGPLANNGGPTSTHALLSGSPAVDGGNNDGAPATDQRGFPRIVNGTIDIGAYERQMMNFVVDIAIDENDGSYVVGDLSLREAMLLATTNPGHDVVEFAPTLAGATIALTMGELLANSDMTIAGPGARQLAISGNNTSRVFNIAAGATIEIHDVTISSGRSSANGGGILNSGALTIADSTITGNTGGASASHSRGGGIYNSGTLTVASSTVTGNTVIGGMTSDSNGGGIFSASGVVTIVNSTISGNSASRGGGVYNNAAMTIKSSTISENFTLGGFGSRASGEPGGILNSQAATLTIQNTIVASNRVPSPFTFPAAHDVIGAFHSLGNNLIGTTHRSDGWVESDLMGSGFALLDPRLAPLADNGGPTMTHALLAASPAIDAGNNSGAPATDQRGQPRPIDGNSDGNPVIDIGAFELTIPPQQFRGTEGDDSYIVQLDSTGATVQVSGPGTAFTAPRALAPLLSFETLGGNDQVTIDFKNGNPLPNNGMEFLGGLHGNPGDRLIFVNADEAIGHFNPTRQFSSDGVLTVDGRRITLFGVEQIDVSGFKTFTVVKSGGTDFNILSRDDGTVRLTDASTHTTLWVANVETLIVDAATNEPSSMDDVLFVSASGTIPIGLIEYRAGIGRNALVMSAPFSNTGRATVDSTVEPGGTLEIAVDDRAQLFTHRFRQTSLGLDNGARAVVLPNGTDAGTSVLTELTINPGGTLDINDNALIVDYAGASPAATIRSKIIEGRGGTGIGNGKWNGTGITSGTAQQVNATMPESRSVAYAENAALPLGPYSSFRGQPVDSTSVLIAYTRTADANLDGVVNDDDVTIVGATYAPGVTQPHWALGDFEYNGFVDDDDVTLLGAFYDPTAEPLAAPMTADDEGSLRSLALVEIFSALADDESLQGERLQNGRAVRPVLSGR